MRERASFRWGQPVHEESSLKPHIRAETETLVFYNGFVVFRGMYLIIESNTLINIFFIFSLKKVQ